MSGLKDIFSFEMFNLGDMWDKIKKNPARLLYGGIDPLSTDMWNGILGKKDEPLIDQMGGAYGGHYLSAFGQNEGGAYGRAREAGINTGPGESAQDAAHVIAALLAGNYGMGQLGGGGAQGGQGWQQYARQMPGQQQQMPQQQMPQTDLYAILRQRAEQKAKEEEMKKLLASQLGGFYGS